MFLIANGLVRGGSVLLPSHGHTLKVSTRDGDVVLPKGPLEIAFDDGEASEIRYCTSSSISRANTSRCRDAYLVRFEQMFNRKVNVSENLLRNPRVPEALNARVLLPGGYFVERPAGGHAGVDKVRWKCGTLPARPLTDRAQFKRNVGDSCTMFIRYYRNDTRCVKRVNLPCTGKTFTVTLWNQDAPCNGSGTEDWTLDEFDILFKLTSLGKLSIKERQQRFPQGRFRLPARAKNSTVGPLSNCRPICGAGQCDPEDP